jgi:hypothetical protein
LTEIWSFVILEVLVGQLIIQNNQNASPSFVYFNAACDEPKYFKIKLGVWVGYIKWQHGIATQVSVVKVKVTDTKNRNSVSAQ